MILMLRETVNALVEKLSEDGPCCRHWNYGKRVSEVTKKVVEIITK